MTPADEKALRTYLATLAMAGFRDNEADLALCTDDVVRFVGKLAPAVRWDVPSDTMPSTAPASSPPSAGEEEIARVINQARSDWLGEMKPAATLTDTWSRNAARAVLSLLRGGSNGPALTKGERR